MIDKSEFNKIDLNQVQFTYHTIKVDKDNHLKIVKPWYGWLVTTLFGWNTKLDSALTAELFNYIQEEARHASASQQDFKARLNNDESDKSLISNYAHSQLSHLVEVFTTLGKREGLHFHGKDPTIQATYSISRGDIDRIETFLLNAVVSPQRSLLLFNRIQEIARTLIVNGRLVGNEKDSAQKAMELIYLINKFEEVAANQDHIIKGAVHKEGVEYEFTIDKRDLTKLKETILNALQRGEMPSFEWMTTAITFDGSPINTNEATFIEFCQKKLPNLNKSLIGYELLQKKTKKLKNTHDLKPAHIVLKGEIIPCFETKKWDSPFLIHAIGLNDWGKTKFNKIINQEYDGNLCTSLIDQTSAFFAQNDSLALVLSVNPETIVATNSHDIQSPAIQPSENKEMDSGADFHNLYGKLRILIGYISRIYQASGLSSQIAGEDYSRYLRLQSLIEDYLGQLSSGSQALDVLSIERVKSVLAETLYNQDILLNEFPNHPIIHELIELSKELITLKEKYTNAEIFKRHYDREQGVPFFQLEELMNHYKTHPPENENEEFYKLFGRQGLGITEELGKMLTFLESLKTHPTFFRYYFNRIQSPAEIMSQTARSEDRGVLPWNEINLDLRQREGIKQGAQIEALLIDQQALNEMDSEAENHLLTIVKQAQALNIPLLLRN